MPLRVHVPTAIHSDEALDAPPIFGRGGSVYTADSVFRFFVHDDGGEVPLRGALPVGFGSVV